jgi:hypothetical protein
MNSAKSNQNPVSETGLVETTKSNQAHSNNLHTKIYAQNKPAPKIKRLFWMVGGGLVAFILLAILLIAPFGQQSGLAMGLDAVGRHKAALSVDLITRNSSNGLFQLIGGLDLSNPQACTQAVQQKLSSSEFKLEALQGNSFTDARPVKADFADKFNTQISVQGSLDSQKVKAGADINLSLTADTGIINKIATENGSESGQDYGQIRGNLAGSTRMDRDALYFTISALDIKTNDFTSNNQLNNWYKSDFKYPQEERERQRNDGITELMEASRDLLNIKPGEMFGQNTISTMAKTVCDSQTKIEVLAPAQVTLGQGSLAQTKTLRPIRVTPSTDSQAQINAQVELSSKIQSDEQLKNYLKAKYSSVAKAATALNKILPEREEADQNEYKRRQEEYTKAMEKLNNDLSSGNYSTPVEFPMYPSYSEIPTKKVPAVNVPTQEEYDKQIDQAFSNPKSADELRTQLQDSLKQQQELFEVKMEPVLYYLDMETGNLAGYESSQVIVFKDKAFEQNKSQTLKDILKDGVRVRNQAWNIKVNQVDDLQMPAESKNIQDFQKDFEKTDAGNRLNDLKKSSTQDDSMNTQII